VYEQTSTSYAPGREGAISSTRLLGQVMFLVAVAIGALALGTYLGRDLSQGTGQILFFVAFGMLLLQAFGGARFRVGAFAIGWLYALAFILGLGLGPAIAYVAETDASALTSAAGGTALITLGMGAAGFAMSKDLAPWMRPLSYVVLGAVVISLGALIFGGLGSLSPLISLVILGASAALILVDFNYLRKHGTEDDTVWLATGIFVSIVNIFLSLLNLFGR
jgi:FtsH-binding integral membrane protein